MQHFRAGKSLGGDMSGRVGRSRIAARFLGLLCAAAMLLPSGARAEYPDRPIRLIIPFAAGGATDILGRSVADFLGKEFKQSVIVENKPGANTSVAADMVAHAPPDGYTLLIAAASTLVLNPLLYRKPTIDPAAFRPLSIMVEVPLIMVVNKAVPAQSVAEFAAYAKQNPGKVNYASSGAGGPLHLAGELFNISAGVNMTHVPYRGSAPALTDLIFGQVQVMFDPVSSSLEHVRGGSLRALGVTAAERTSLLPDVPTVAESGFADFRATAWYGLVAPKGIPEEVAKRLVAASDKALADPMFRKPLENLGYVVMQPGGEPAFARFIQQEHDRWSKVIKSQNISLD
jgi:tripartite-type tricarboxylate transporter receptor subunit TctC